MFLNVDAFLAPTQRVDTDILVVEGWVHPYAIRASAEEFQNHSYHRKRRRGFTEEGRYSSGAHSDGSVTCHGSRQDL